MRPSLILIRDDFSLTFSTLFLVSSLNISFIPSFLSFFISLSLSCQPQSNIPLSLSFSFSLSDRLPRTAGPPLPQTLLPPPRPRCQFLLLHFFFAAPLIPIMFRLPSKRKASEELDGPNDAVSSSSKDFEAGRVTCEACGDSVSYRDERTGVFTTKHWDAHKLGWFAPTFLFFYLPRLPRFLPF